MRKSSIQFILIIISLLLFSTISKANILVSKSSNLSNNWLFLRSDLGGIWAAVRPAAPESPESVQIWTEVNLPHCYNATDALDPKGNVINQCTTSGLSKVQAQNGRARIKVLMKGRNSVVAVKSSQLKTQLVNCPNPSR